MKTMTINLYDFNELSNDAKQAAVDKWYEFEDYPILTEDLTESCKYLLDENKVEFSDLKILYSLSSCQGDGFCFTGTFEKDEKIMCITHNYRYYFASSVTFNFSDEEGEEIDEVEELKYIYFAICKELEKEGYSILEYRMDFDEFDDLCSANEYTFESSGVMNNG